MIPVLDRAFSQVVSKEGLSSDEVHERLIFLRLTCHKTMGEAWKYSAAKEYAIIPCNSIRGRVQVVPADVGTTLWLLQYHKKRIKADV